MPKAKKHIVIIGAGFGGLYAAKKLIRSMHKITLIDKNNYHLFQPLLYQVATAQLAPEDIAYPVREIFKNKRNITVLNETVSTIDLDNKKVVLECGELVYDKLIVATGVKPDYFGNDSWRIHAPPLKTLGDALIVRRKILSLFERAESEMLHPCEPYPLNFVIIGGGPTGIELAGALAELSKYSLKNEFRKIDPGRTKIYVVEAGNSILPGFPSILIRAAEKSLNKLGVILKTGYTVTDISGDELTLNAHGHEEKITSKVVLWAAGVRAYQTAKIFKNNKKINTDKKGRIIVEKNLTLPSYPDVYIIGDLAHFEVNGKLLPGTAPVAIQEGIFAAKHIMQNVETQFNYFNKGSLAVIGRNSAVADFGKLKISGFLAWILWIFVHIGYLIGFRNKTFVLIKWAWNYFIRKSTARIIYNFNHKQNGKTE